MSTTRDTLRGSIFSAKPRVTEVTMDNGTVVEVRQPLVGQLLDMSSIENAKTRMARMLVTCCYIKETGELLFDDTDEEGLMNLPSGAGTYQTLMDAVQANMGLVPQMEDAAKK